jgi:hypothetical protein
LRITETLPYARDRIVECYFWILGVYFEPCYSRARIITTKYIILLSVLDDTYDIYATLDECRLLTIAFKRYLTSLGIHFVGSKITSIMIFIFCC